MSIIPDFLIIGAQKSGTTAAARNLSLHPSIQVFTGENEYGQKEIEFYNQHWSRGIAWYTTHFDVIGKHIGEKTAELLHRKICHERMFRVNRDLKLIVLLRSPIDRAYSQWKMARLLKRDESRDFKQVIQDELRVLDSKTYRERFYNCCNSGISNWREGYLLKGFYAEQLESVYKWFSREQVFVGVAERIRRNMDAGYTEIFDFLEVKREQANFGEYFVGGACAPMSEGMQWLLADIYRIPNQRLYSILGFDIPEWE